MNRRNSRNTNWLIFIAVLVALALWIDLSNTITATNPFTGKALFTRNTEIQLGLDLRGGLQTLLEADVPATTPVSKESLSVTRQILERRANALGVSEVTMQIAGDRRIVAEFPGAKDPEAVIASLQQTGLLEFVDFGNNPVPEGSTIKTDWGTSAQDATATPEASAEPVYHTVFTGADLTTASVGSSSAGEVGVNFSLTTEGAKIFREYTTTHVGQYLGIVLDKTVISAPRVNTAITDGSGTISGNFTLETANALAVQLRYGSLPVPVKDVQSQTVGATLGDESVRKSVTAGIIGLTVVALFMLLYYRLPGFVAVIALLIYALLSLALFKLIPVVLTLPGLAGFILSIGVAVDANVLIFERLKEELRGGRTIHQAIDLGWNRAWPSIRDSNISTLITCLILYGFGNAFGASIVKGFSVTLALGVGVSLFTAIIVTRAILHLILDNVKLAEHPRWFGL